MTQDRVLLPRPGLARAGHGPRHRRGGARGDGGLRARQRGVRASTCKRLCFDTPLEEMVETEVQQPALVATSLAMLAALRARGIEPDYVIGHSVGEFAALAAAESVGVEETIALVRERGLAMAEAARERPGSMAAILGLDDEVVERLCRKILGVWPANYNCPGQIVVSGENDAVDECCAQAEEEGARRTVKLQGLGRVPLAARRARGRAAAAGGRGGQVRRAAGGVHVDGHGPVRGRRSGWARCSSTS